MTFFLGKSERRFEVQLSWAELHPKQSMFVFYSPLPFLKIWWRWKKHILPSPSSSILPLNPQPQIHWIHIFISPRERERVFKRMEKALIKVGSIKAGGFWISKKAKEEFSNITEDLTVRTYSPSPSLFFFSIHFFSL